MKLTKAQSALLTQIVECPFKCVDYYPPAKKLVEKGLAFFDNGYLKPTRLGLTESEESA
jgi:hypothetical protein